MSVAEHCRIVGAVARTLLERVPPAAARHFPYYSIAAAALHDVGKASPGFQQKMCREHLRGVAPEWADRTGLEDDHTVIGASAVWRYLGGGFKRPTAATVALIHHGEEHGARIRADAGEVMGGEAWAAERRRLIEELVAEYGEVPNETLNFETESLLCGLTTVADWIGSDEEHFPPAGLPSDVNLSERSTAAVTQCGWNIHRLKPELSFSDMFDGRTPYPVQREFIDTVTGPGLYILEAPMGTGKTEAALYATYRLMLNGHNQGFYFGLPTRLTSDKIHERVEPFLKGICDESTSPRLAHGKAWLKEFDHGGKCFNPQGRFVADRVDIDPRTSWFNPLKRALLYPWAVGTIDQALLAVLRVRHYFVRAFGLAGKVVILDEVHSYDVYTSSLIERLIGQLLATGCTVIVLSATLSGERRAKLLNDKAAGNSDAPYPLMTRKRSNGINLTRGTPPPSKSYEVAMRNWGDKEVAEAAVRKAKTGSCVLCIANTIERAQRWYNAVKCMRQDESLPVGLLHSKFPVFRREELEHQWLAKLGANLETRPAGCVLVATQVVEQSVDIDADALITELAPTDMLLQRMGRVWRHRDPPCRGDAFVVCGNAGAATDEDELRTALGEKSCLVYQPYVLWRSWDVWRTLEQVKVPEDIREVIETTYAPRDETTEHIRALMQQLDAWREKMEMHAHGTHPKVHLPVGADEEGVFTRYSDLPMQDVLLARRIDSTGREAQLELLDEGAPVTVHADRKDFETTRRLHRQLVPVPRYVFKKLGGLDAPAWLQMHFHGPTPVWTLEKDGAPFMMGRKATGYTYDALRGLQRLQQTDATPAPCDEYEEEVEEWD